MTKMFANAGLAYVLGTIGGGVYGFQEGLKVTPSHRWKIQLNSVLNHCSKHGSRIGNRMGVLSVFYSLYEGAADHVSVLDPEYELPYNFFSGISYILMLIFVCF